jgi:hypothetical protein
LRCLFSLFGLRRRLVKDVWYAIVRIFAFIHFSRHNTPRGFLYLVTLYISALQKLKKN